MKTKFICITLFTIFSVSAFAQKIVKANIKVYGNCVMCKKRIETALDHPGIKTASWNTQTKDLEVVYNANKISEDQIHQIIASVGHDTDKMKAKDEVYSKLPFCCLYRNTDGGHDSHSHSGN